MTSTIRTSYFFILILSAYLSVSCKGQNGSNPAESDIEEVNTPTSRWNSGSQVPLANIPSYRITDFVRRIHEDKKGNLWFGTNGDGVLRYNGDLLEYFSIKEGFLGLAVRAIVEDNEGHLWFGTEMGLTQFDGNAFSHHFINDDETGEDIWSLVIDHNGLLWMGTYDGVFTFDGKEFTPFELPETELDLTRGVTSTTIVHCILEDSEGKMWFGTNGGIFIYDGDSLTQLSEADGLCNNVVNDILEANDGTMWFATHHAGVCSWDGKEFISYDEVEGVEAWSLFEDDDGNIWFPVEGHGVYRYDGRSFTHFNAKTDLTIDAVQCIFQDSKGIIWIGGYTGLYRFSGDRIVPVFPEGPWVD